ncbi:hypothetical protein ACVDFE_20690 [Lentzea chajnantorensis]
MKSYGRAPTFLSLTGSGRARSAAGAVSGDLAATRRVELALPEAGVCGGAGVFDAPDEQADGGGCCEAPGTARVVDADDQHLGGVGHGGPPRSR